jgi:hypothetical protein
MMQSERLDELYSSASARETWIKSAPAIFIITRVFERPNRVMG